MNTFIIFMKSCSYKYPCSCLVVYMLGFIVLPLSARFTSHLGTLVGYSRPTRVLFNDIDMVSRSASSVECCVSDGREGAARVVTAPSGISIPPRVVAS